MSDDESSSSDLAIPSRGVLPSSKLRGWQGEEMELEHARTSDSKRGTTTAVDLSQFRNEEVGKGYQAKFVVRQRHVADSDDKNASVIKDMTAQEKPEKSASSRSSHKSSSSRKSKRKKSSSREREKNAESDRLQKYLRSENLRRFRKELEKF